RRRSRSIRTEITRALALRIIRAAEEPSVLRPALHHLAGAARVADLVGLRRLRVPALALLRDVELRAESLVEALQQIDALFFSFFDRVELALHLRGELRVHEVELTSYQAIDDEFAERRRAERAPAVDLLDVIARLHLADDLGVRARTPDAALFELA